MRLTETSNFTMPKYLSEFEKKLEAKGISLNVIYDKECMNPNMVFISSFTNTGHLNAVSHLYVIMINSNDIDGVIWPMLETYMHVADELDTKTIDCRYNVSTSKKISTLVMDYIHKNNGQLPENAKPIAHTMVSLENFKTGCKEL